jgi:TonB family protein
MLRFYIVLLTLLSLSASSNAETDPEITAWHLSVMSHVRKFIKYPPKAKANGETGVVVVKFTIDSTGHLIDAKIANPSCYDELNQEALATVRRAEPFPSFPSKIKSTRETFRQPLVFMLKANTSLTIQAQALADPCRTNPAPSLETAPRSKQQSPSTQPPLLKPPPS